MSDYFNYKYSINTKQLSMIAVDMNYIVRRFRQVNFVPPYTTRAMEFHGSITFGRVLVNILSNNR